MSDQNETRDRQPEGRRPAWQAGTPRGQERVVSYESDERYWTDYLRVALPVVGLLLMLGLLFWWANSIIGDEQGTQPTSTIASGTNVAVAATNTPLPTTEAGLTPTEVVQQTTPDANGGDTGQTQGDGGPATEEPADECDGEFVRGNLVAITEDNTNFRPRPNLEVGDFPQLDAGTQLEISSDCYTLAEDDETRFWRVDLVDAVEGVDDNARGFVSEAFLEVVEE